MDIGEVLALLNRRHGATYASHHRCDGGTRGAYEVRDAAGDRAILKFGAGPPGWLNRLRQSEKIARGLRPAGYPVARTLALEALPDGGWCQLQEFVAGTPFAAPLAPGDIDLLLALNERQAGRCPPVGAWANWSGYAREVLFADSEGWLAALRGHSLATRALRDAVLARAWPFVAAPLSTADVVHGDFVAENVLADTGRIAAVIDFGAAGCGHRALDLARLLVWWYADMDEAGRRRLNERIAAIATPAERAVYLSYEIVDVAAYVVAHYPADADAIAARGLRVLAESAAG